MNPSAKSSVSWGEAVAWLRSQPQYAALVRESYWDEPLLQSATRYWASPEWKIARELLGKPPGKALEFGAGRGILSYALARDGWKVSAIEPDADASVGLEAIRRLAKESNLPIEATLGISEAMPFPEGTFDLVIGRQVLHHIPDLAKACREAFRVLRPGGLFVALREPVISRKEDLAIFLKNHPLTGIYGGENALLLGEYRNAIAASGLAMEREVTPFESELNLYPESVAKIRTHFVRNALGRFHLARFAWLVAPFAPRAFLRRCAEVDHTPGRLYSFVARKR